MAVSRKSDVKVSKGAKKIDASDKIMAPGFIDVHIHGGKAIDAVKLFFNP